MIPLWLRLAISVAIFAALAGADLLRNGRDATRWREYVFLIFCVALAMTYGVINDQMTSRISWEYFYYGKELAPILGPAIPPDPAALHRQAVRIGIESTWWAGLVFGVALLLANNPRPDLPRLPIPRLIARLPVFLLITLAFALVLGAAGKYGALNWISDDFRELAATNLWRPRRFMTVFGIHLGGYIGGVVATAWAVLSIRRAFRTSGGWDGLTMPEPLDYEPQKPRPKSIVFSSRWNLLFLILPIALAILASIFMPFLRHAPAPAPDYGSKPTWSIALNPGGRGRVISR